MSQFCVLLGFICNIFTYHGYHDTAAYLPI